MLSPHYFEYHDIPLEGHECPRAVLLNRVDKYRPEEIDMNFIIKISEGHWPRRLSTATCFAAYLIMNYKEFDVKSMYRDTRVSYYELAERYGSADNPENFVNVSVSRLHYGNAEDFSMFILTYGLMHGAL